MGVAIESTCILNKTILEFLLTTFFLSDFNKNKQFLMLEIFTREKGIVLYFI